VKIASGLVKDRHVLTVVILLLVAALVPGVAGCRHGAHTYQLSISSGSGGNVTSPGEGTFHYSSGTEVPLVATPDEGYQFRSWTGYIANVADPSAASTTITMNGNCAIVANFASEGGGPGPP
jgi:hypothetical protein